MILRSPWTRFVTAFLLMASAALAEEAVLLRYPFTKGKASAEAAEEKFLHANVLTAGDGKLCGISPVQEQCFLLLRQGGERFPASREEAQESPFYLSFAITPVEGKTVEVQKLAFAIGAASVRLEGRLYGFAKVQFDGEELDLPIAFTRDEDEAGDAFPVRKGDQRDAMVGRGTVDLSRLPAPLDTPVTFCLYFYLSDADLEKIPEGTNYSIRIDDISLLGETH